MTNPNYRHVIVVADRSGSMASCREATQSGINEFFNKQASETVAPLSTTVSLWQFDDKIERVWEHVPLEDRGEYKLEPRNMTALFDAICKSFDTEGQWLASLAEDDRPSLVVVLIASDGYENFSQKHTIADVRQRITTQREQYKWKIIFIGTDIDAETYGQELGIDRGLTVNSGRMSQANTYIVAANLTSRLFTNDSAEFTDQDRKWSMTPDAPGVDQDADQDADAAAEK